MMKWSDVDCGNNMLVGYVLLPNVWARALIQYKDVILPV